MSVYFRYDEEKRALEKVMLKKLRKSRDPNYVDTDSDIEADAKV